VHWPDAFPVTAAAVQGLCRKPLYYLPREINFELFLILVHRLPKYTYIPKMATLMSMTRTSVLMCGIQYTRFPMICKKLMGQGNGSKRGHSAGKFFLSAVRMHAGDIRT
jgi:hypothetical protein